MAEDKKVTISRTLNGDTIYYIARNSSGTVFARALTLKELETAIKTYKEPPPVEEEGEEVLAEPKEKKFLINKLLGKVQKRKEEEEVAEAELLQGETEQETIKEKQFLENDLKTKVEERKKQSKKTSFWDKLK